MNIPKIIRNGMLSGAIGLAAVPLTVAGGTLTPEQAAGIYAKAGAAVPHYSLPERAPTIHLVPKHGLVQLFCSRPSAPECDGCSRALAVDEQCVQHARNFNLRGIQGGEEIYLDESMDFSEPFSASVVYHEMIHYLQHHAKGEVSSCQDWVEREAEAYREQAKQLQREGATFLLIRRVVAQGHALRCE